MIAPPFALGRKMPRSNGLTIFEAPSRGPADWRKHSSSLPDCGDDLLRAGHEAEALLDVPDRRLAAKIRRGRAAAILHQHAIVTEKMRVGERVKHALVGVDATEHERFYVEIAQDAVERRVPEAADAIFVDLDVFGKLLELVDDRRRPTVLLQKVRPVAGQRAAEPDA